MPAGEFHHPSPPPQPPPGSDAEEGWVWSQIKSEARVYAEAERARASYLYSTILSHSSLERSLSFHLGNKLCSSTLLSTLCYDLFLNIFSNDSFLRSASGADLCAARFRDPACTSFSHFLLNYKGFLARQAQRVAHKLWTQSRMPLALALQSRISDVFAIGKFGGDHHPKIGDRVLIGAGATILANVKIGEGVKIGADSLVLIDRCVQETRSVSNAGIGCREKPEGHLLNADRSKEKRYNPECGGGGGGAGGAMAAEHGEYANGGGNGSGRRRRGGFIRGVLTLLITLLLILNPRNAFSASRQPHAPPSPYSPPSPIFPPKTHYPPPPPSLAGMAPPPPDDDNLSDILGTPPPPSEDDCLC